MGIFDKMKNLVGIEEVDEDEEEFEQEVKSNDMTKLTPASERIEPRSFAKPAAPVAADPAPTTNTVKNFTSQWKMVVIEPTDFNDSPKLVDSLKAKKPVIINLENIETDVARKIFDFLSGATYALNGNVQKIANNIFVFAPENVDVAYNQTTTKPVENTYKSPWK